MTIILRTFKVWNSNSIFSAPTAANVFIILQQCIMRWSWTTFDVTYVVLLPLFSMEILTHAWCILARTFHPPIHCNFFLIEHLRLPFCSGTRAMVYQPCTMYTVQLKRSIGDCKMWRKCFLLALVSSVPPPPHITASMCYVFHFTLFFYLFCSVMLWSRFWAQSNACSGATHQYNRTAYIEWTIRTERRNRHIRIESRTGIRVRLNKIISKTDFGRFYIYSNQFFVRKLLFIAAKTNLAKISDIIDVRKIKTVTTKSTVNIFEPFVHTIEKLFLFDYICLRRKSNGFS